MIQLLLVLLGLVSNSSQSKTNYGNSTDQTQQSIVGDTGGDEGHPKPPKIIGG